MATLPRLASRRRAPVGGGHHQKYSRLGGPRLQPGLVHRHAGHMEESAHRGAQGLRIGHLRGARQCEDSRGAQREGGAHHRAHVAWILHCVQHQHGSAGTGLDVREAPLRRLDHGEDALGVLGRGQLRELFLAGRMMPCPDLRAPL
jgi:hypothetical protein